MEVTYARADSSQLTDDLILEQIIGTSPAIQALREDIRRFAQYSVNVLITGPTGTGKEVIARTIHKVSPRRHKPFIPVDCAAVTGTLFASQMFGHLKGAFTGATHATVGCFRAADGGTIFLDEIGEMELALQAKLLRVLQQRAVVPVGGHEEIPVDASVIAATNRDLVEEVRRGCFREDLYYRLNVVRLNPPPLAERREDIPLLVSHFLGELSLRHGSLRKEISDEALAVLVDYSWPGNVRQLQNLLERLTVSCPSDTITADDVAVHLATSVPPLRPGDRDDGTGPAKAANSDGNSSVSRVEQTVLQPGDVQSWYSLEEVQRIHIQSTLEHTFYNQSAAAELLQVDRSTLRRMMEKLGVEFRRSKRGRPRKPR